MPRIARGQTGGLFTHVINRGNGRQSVFGGAEDYAAFARLLADVNERTPMRIVSFCLMPNHFHLILWPHEDGDLSQWMQWLMSTHVRHHHQRHGGSGHLWQGRFKSFVIKRRRPTAAQRGAGLLRVGDPIIQVARYVERNPVRAGLAESAEQWPWSSLRWWSNPAAAPSFWQEVGFHRPQDWPSVVNEPQSEAELTALRQCIVRGRPFGPDPS